VAAFLEDLSPFFADPCWMFVLPARVASVAVILRRGPGKWWRVTLWDTRRDRFEPGQWFWGWIYPDKCDVSPDGKLLIYFAGKHRPRDVETGYDRTWTAVSRPPYLTALALWPIGDTWGGQGVFIDNRTVMVGTAGKSFGGRHHPDHPPGPLRLVESPVVDHFFLKEGDPRHDAVPGWRQGWQGTLAPVQPKNRMFPQYSSWRKTSGRLTLERDASRRAATGGVVYEEYLPSPSRRRSLYTLLQKNGAAIALFEAHWADFDQRGRLVATVGGQVLEGKIAKDGKLVWRQLAAIQDERPAPMEALSWAQRWSKRDMRTLH
jgi:hypothetical protein